MKSENCPACGSLQCGLNQRRGDHLCDHRRMLRLEGRVAALEAERDDLKEALRTEKRKGITMPDTTNYCALCEGYTRRIAGLEAENKQVHQLWDDCAKELTVARATLGMVKHTFGECNAKNARGEMSAREAMKKCKRILSTVPAPIAVVNFQCVDCGKLDLVPGDFGCEHCDDVKVGGKMRPVTLCVMAKGGDHE